MTTHLPTANYPRFCLAYPVMTDATRLLFTRNP